MKRKPKMKGVLSCLLALVLALSITPSVFAEGTGTTIYVDAINGDDTQEGVGTTSDKAYKTVAVAVAAAQSGDTIQLGEGNYTLHGVSSVGHTKGKDLTFVGQGADKTGWNIGAEVPDPEYYGTQYNGDTSFEGAKTITFKKMTLSSGKVDYLGFQFTDNTIIEDCVINGKTFYWGYQTAIFRNTIFNCPNGDYAIWTYSSPEMTFDNCTFNSSGKVINVYTDFGAGKNDITVNFNGCTVNNSGLSRKQVLNINDYNMGDYKYVINISGDNVVKGVDTDKITCSRLFGYGGDTSHNTGRTIVNFGNTTVWTPVRQNGKMVGEMVNAKAYHNSGVTADGVTYTNNVEGSNDSLYAEGYKDHMLVTTYVAWKANKDGTITRDGTKECKYCGYQETVTESQGKLTYNANGGKGKPVSAPGTPEGSVTVAKNVFTRSNYTFTGWNTQADGTGTAYKPGDTFTLTGNDTVLYAQWSKISGSAGTGTSETAKPTDSPKTGDNSSLALWFALLLANGGAVTATTIYGRKNKRSVK